MTLKQLATRLYEFGNLGRVSRSGLYQFLYEDYESVAEHAYKVAVIGYFLGKQMKADTKTVLVMALFHDARETRTGDGNWIQKPYLNNNEELAVKDQLAGENELLEILQKYKERKSLESKIVKDADYIEYFMALKVLEMKGNKEATIRIGYETKDLKFMHTDEGRRLLKEVLKTDPNAWTRVAHKKTMKKYKEEVK